MGKNRDFSKFPNAITVLDNGNVGINSAITPDWSYTGLKSSMSYNISLYGYTGTSGIAFNIYYNTGWKNVTNGGGAYIETDSNSNIVFYTSTTGILSGASTTTAERIRISGTGNVGIGTSSPAAKLHIYSSDTNMASDGATSYTYSKLRVEPYNGSSIGLSFGLIGPNINYIQASYNNGTTASMSIQPYGGNVGIGVTSASYRLSVANELQVGAQGGNDFTYIGGGSGVGSIIRNYYATGTISNELRANGDNFFNNVMGKTIAYGGIKFGSGASTMNYYEEGTWTPILSGSNGGDYTAAGGNSGKYTRVGNVVTITCTLVWNGGGSYSGNLCVRGIPFTNGSNRCHGSMGAIAGGLSLSSGYTYWSFLIDPGYNFVYIIQNASTGYSHGASVSSSGTIYAMTVTYLI